MRNIKAAIFDIDGTLLDSMPAWDDASEEFLIVRGVKPKPDFRKDLRQLGGHQLPEYFRTEYGIDEPWMTIKEAIGGLIGEFYREKAALKSGAIEVLDELKRRGIKMCAATATDRQLIEPALQRCGLMPYFGRVFTCGEEKTNKREPDIYFRAAAFLGEEASETLVFEDALYAIRTAKNAGFNVAAVYDATEHDTQDVVRSLADYYYASLSDFRWTE